MKISKIKVSVALLTGLALTGISGASCQAQTPSRAAAPESLANVVARVEPGVVVIETTQPAKASSDEEQDQDEDDAFLYLFTQQHPHAMKPIHAKGSGFIIDSRGDIVTNYHVASPKNTQIEVVLEDGTPYAATFVGGDENLDISVIRIKPHGKTLTPLAWGNSDGLRQGDPVIAIGDPDGFKFTVTRGIVSALHRNLSKDGPDNSHADFIQSDAALNPGNSGGPLMTPTGQVVGINSEIFSRGGGSEGLGFAIPSAEARKAVADIIAYGEIRYSELGFDVGALLLNGGALDIKPNPGRGAFVTNVYSGSAAEKAGVKIGDIVTKFDDKLVLSAEQLRTDIAFSEAGTHHTLTIQRNGQTISLSATPEWNPPPPKKPPVPGQGLAP